MMRGRALRYLGWQAVDGAVPRLLANLTIAVALCWVAGRAIGQDPMPDARLRVIITQLHLQLAFVFVLLFMHGLVSIDRAQGYYRFYLAKPVSPVWFYGQAIALALLGTLGASAGYVIISSWLIRPLWVWSVLPQTFAVFALYGMLMFVFGMFSRHDWLLAMVAMLMASALRQHWPAAESRLGRVIEAVLPPSQFIGSNEHPTTAQWLWIGGWGVGLVALGLLIVWRRPLGED
jgi:hypothetical protein